MNEHDDIIRELEGDYSYDEYIARFGPWYLEEYAPLTDWFTLEGSPLAITVTHLGPTVVHTRRGDIEYSIGPSNVHEGSEVIANIVTGSSFTEAVLQSMVVEMLPSPLPDGLSVETLDAPPTGTHCFLVRSFDSEQQMDDAGVDALMRDFSDIAGRFVREWDAV